MRIIPDRKWWRFVPVFIMAMVLRMILFNWSVDNPEVIFQPDSKMYTSLALGIRHHGTFSDVNSPNTPDVERLPGYPAFLAIVTALSGGVLTVIMVQVILDALGCMLICFLAEKVWRGAGWVAGLLAAGNLGMITYSHFLLNDSLFLFVFVLLIFGMFRLLSDLSWKWSFLTGAGIAAAAYVRPVATYIPFFFGLFVFCYCLLTHKDSFVPALGKSILILFAFAVCVSPWMARNYSHFGRFKLTAQGGEHLLQYIVPFTWQYSRGIPFIQGMKQANQAFAEEMGIKGIDVGTLNPFEKSDYQVKKAVAILKDEPVTAIAEAWVFGMVKNLFAPAVVDLSYLLKIERPHFFYSEGTTTVERSRNFLRGMKGWFAWAVVANLGLVMVARLVQVWGLIRIMRGRTCEALLFTLIMAYFLLISGPVGYAKYRLPFEPILIVLLAIGLKDLWERWKRGSWRSEAQRA